MDEASQQLPRQGPADAQADAPARVNLIGEHTDYCQGLVLPLPLVLCTKTELRRRPDDWVAARTTLEGGDRLVYRLGDEQPGRGWLDYVQGVTAAVRQRGLPLQGFELDVTSDIPAGAGLASSAALGVALLRVLRKTFALPLDDVELARLVHTSETTFVGAPVGLMDPLAASLGQPGRPLFIDTRSLAMEQLSLPEAVEVGVVHSGISHRNAGGTYAQRRREADAAAQALGVSFLREVTEADLPRIEALPPPLNGRARHVVTENARVLAFVAALRRGDSLPLGALLDASHHSLRDSYEVSHPDVDALVALAQSHEDVLGARMTGGGCGGAVLFLAKPGCARAAGSAVTEAYCRQTGRPGVLLVPPTDGFKAGQPG